MSYRVGNRVLGHYWFNSITINCFICLLRSVLVSSADPCVNYAENIGDPRRSAAYIPSIYEPDLCDDETVIDATSWYRVDSYTGYELWNQCPKINHCGTNFPVWMNGQSPTQASPGPKTVQVCSPSYADMNAGYVNCCDQYSSTVQVKWCLDNTTGREYFVYQLKPLPGCYMAYCVGNGLPCPSGQIWSSPANSCIAEYPAIAAPQFIGPVTMNDKYLDGTPYVNFQFICRVTYTPSSVANVMALFDVALTFNGVAGTPKTTNTTTSTFDVVFWPMDIKGNVGKSVGCQVSSYWLGEEHYKSLAVSSTKFYWVGITYSVQPSFYNSVTQRIELDEGTSSVTLYFHATVPITCPCEINIYVSTTVKKSTCWLDFKADQPSTTNHTLTIKADVTLGTNFVAAFLTFSPIIDTGNFWANYQLQEIPMYITDHLPVTVCWSVADPHIYTFDGVNYSTFFVGDFILFKSSDPRYFEVDVRQAPCGAVSCNCAVAVREGNNAIGLYWCDKSAPPTLMWYLKDSSVLGADVTISEDGTQYNISMPSGAYINVHVVNHFLDIYVYPIKADFAKASGLCGNWDGNPNNDLTPAGSTTPDNGLIEIYGSMGHVPLLFPPSYQLDPTVSLINGHFFPPTCLQNLPPPQQYTCFCDKNQYIQSKTYVNCSTAVVQPMFLTMHTSSCEIIKGKRDDSETVQEDHIITASDIPLQPLVNQSQPTAFSWPTPSGIISSEANALCSDQLTQLTIYAACVKYVNLTTLLTNCITDIALLDNRNATNGIVEQFQQTCVFNLQLSENGSSTTGSTSPSYVNQLLQSITNQICPNQCSGQGTCNSSICVCNAGFAGPDCSILAGSSPILTGQRKGSLCDARKLSCTSTFLYANNFFRSPSLICRVTSQDTANPSYYSPAAVMSYGELMCGIPASPLSTDATSAVLHFTIAVSNDGIDYSNTLQLVVYDSKCQSCTNSGCHLLNSTCNIDGRCYLVSENNPTNAQLQCNPKLSTSCWTDLTTQGPVCSAGSTGTASSNLLPLIALVAILPIIAIIIIAVLCYKRVLARRNERRRLQTVQTRAVSNDYEPKKEEEGARIDGRVIAANLYYQPDCNRTSNKNTADNHLNDGTHYEKPDAANNPAHEYQRIHYTTN